MYFGQPIRDLLPDFGHPRDLDVLEEIFDRRQEAEQDARLDEQRRAVLQQMGRG